MSLLLTVYTHECIVLASDRRMIYANKIEKDGNVINNIGAHMIDSADKTFLCPNNVGISFCGDGDVNGKPINVFINNMIKNEIKSDTLVEDVPKIIIKYFNSLQKVPKIQCLVAGYNKQEKQCIYSVDVPSKKYDITNTNVQGASWCGEGQTLNRLFQNVAVKKQDNTYRDLPQEGVLWNLFSVQHAIDFTRYAFDVTIQTQKFKNTIKTVGGNIDMLLLTPEGARWVQKDGLK